MVEIELNSKKVAKIKFYLTGANGEFLWIAFELEDGTKEETMYMKGIESLFCFHHTPTSFQNLSQPKTNLKTRPDIIVSTTGKFAERREFIDAKAVKEWFEAFEKKHSDLYCSSYLVENWLADHDLTNNGEVAHAIRVFIKEEVLGDV